MAQDSHSSHSGFGSLLMKGIMGILSITATAAVSTIVQRYITPSAAQPSAIASPAAPMQATEASTLVPIPVTPTFAPPVELTPAPEGQAIDPQTQTNPQAEPQPNPATDPNAPVIVQVEPQIEAQPSPQPDPQSNSLRDQLNRTIQNKWNRN
jgi:hypothetical protein